MSSGHYRLSYATSFADVDWKGNTKTKGGRLIYSTQVAGQYILISFCFLILKLLRKKILLYSLLLVFQSAIFYTSLQETQQKYEM